MKLRKILNFIPLIVCLFLFATIALAGEITPFFPEEKGVDFNELALVRADVFSSVSRIINYALTFLGIVGLVLVIYAGAVWMLARGNEEEIKRAQEMLKGGVIGLVIILGSYALSYWVFTNLINITTGTKLE